MRRQGDCGAAAMVDAMDECMNMSGGIGGEKECWSARAWVIVTSAMICRAGRFAVGVGQRGGARCYAGEHSH